MALSQLRSCRNDSWQTVNHSPGFCALYGVCGHRKDHSGLDCPLNQPGKPLSSPSLQKLQDTCPQLASEFGPDGNYCCTEEQLDTLTHQACPAQHVLSMPSQHHSSVNMLALTTCYRCHANCSIRSLRSLEHGVEVILHYLWSADCAGQHIACWVPSL